MLSLWVSAKIWLTSFRDTDGRVVWIKRKLRLFSRYTAETLTTNALWRRQKRRCCWLFIVTRAWATGAAIITKRSKRWQNCWTRIGIAMFRAERDLSNISDLCAKQFIVSCMAWIRACYIEIIRRHYTTSKSLTSAGTRRIIIWLYFCGRKWSNSERRRVRLTSWMWVSLKVTNLLPRRMTRAMVNIWITLISWFCRKKRLWLWRCE